MTKHLALFILLIVLTACTRSSMTGPLSTPPGMDDVAKSTIPQEKSTTSVPPSTIHPGKQKITPSTPTIVKATASPKITQTLTSARTHETTLISDTGTPPPTPTTKLPGGVPLKTWRDIPIMPGAVTGDEEDDRYRFMLTGTVDDVSVFYKKELPKTGWRFDTQGTGENGAPIFIFSKTGAILSVSVIVLGDVVVVTLAPL